MAAPGKWKAQHTQARDMFPNAVKAWYNKKTGEGVVIEDVSDDEYADGKYDVHLLTDSGAVIDSLGYGVGNYGDKSEASSDAVDWMRKHPKGHDSKVDNRGVY